MMFTVQAHAHVSLCFAANECKISIPDVLMTVAMATSFCSERKMSRVRASRQAGRGEGGEYDDQKINIFFIRHLL